jgi:hypothetical protein
VELSSAAPAESQGYAALQCGNVLWSLGRYDEAGAMFQSAGAEAGNFPALACLWADVALRPMLALLHRVVQRGIDRGEFRPVNPADVLPLIAAPVVLLALWKHSFGQHTDIPMDRHAVLVAHAEMLLRGLASTGAPALLTKGTS